MSTIGRLADLRGFVDSLARSATGASVELIVVDQSDGARCLADLEQRPPGLPWTGTTSPRGVCLGRNVGARLVRGSIIAFPDDNCWYDATTVTRVVERFADDDELGVLAGIQLTADHRPSMLRWQRHAGPVTRRNINHTAIESSTFFRREVFEQSGGFDETIGVGSPGPYQSGEITDLLLRCLATGVRAIYDPAVIVYQDDPRAHPPAGFDVKMRGYGRGFGMLHHRYGLARSQFAYALVRKAAAVGIRAVTGHGAQARADLMWARGAIEGYRGRGLT